MSDDDVAVIEKLFDLKEKGILSEEEFRIKKSEVLHPSKPTVPPKIPTVPPRGGNTWPPALSKTLPVISMILGILTFITCFDETEWDNDTFTGVGTFAFIGLVSGIACISNQKEGRGMAVTGTILSAFAFVMILLRIA